MRTFKYISLALVLVIGTMSFKAPKTGPIYDKEIVIINAVVKFLSQYHFRPKTIDAESSKKVYKMYMERLDGAKRFYTQEDVDVLDFYEDRIGDQVEKNKFDFFDLSLNLLDKGIKKPQEYYKEILSQPFDIEVVEKYETDYEKRSYPKNDKAQRELWRKMLKYETLSRIYTKLVAQESDDFE